MTNKRIIGSYTGQKRGPLLIVFGAMHGNEPAGVEALKLMFGMLEIEPITNPDFEFSGKLVGLVGNVRARKMGLRFINRDLNRQWTPENVSRIQNSPLDNLDEEDLEIKEILEVIHHEIATYQPEKLVILDLHTTTAAGGIFSIPQENKESLRIAIELHAPVIKGLLKGINGTTLHYFTTDNLGVNTVAVTFESGQHQEQLSVHRAIAALTNCMRTIGCVKESHVENRHDAILEEYSKGLPKVAELITIHSIDPEDNFQMAPDYVNFQPVKKGQILAFDKSGKITAAEDGLVLMPLYQKQGEDGFFLIKTLEAF
ncbi:MAG TPA: succinylglutamate desuccinylase [Phaeodactylibacter sp.]|nr:succinylglutamate desuccinylase [Phaeodactylibacter sp.]